MNYDDIKMFLDENKVPFEPVGKDFAIVCPFDPEADGVGDPLLTFTVNGKTGSGFCGGRDHGMASWTEIKELLKDRNVSKYDLVTSQPIQRNNNGVAAKGPSQASILVDLVEASGALLFHDNRKEPFISIPVKNHSEVWFVRSKVFKSWCSMRYWHAKKTAINSDALNSALNAIEGMALFAGHEFILENRVAWFDGAIWYDLSDTEWRAVKMTTKGWFICPPPILFRRYNHQQPQIEPVKGGDPKRVLQFLNIANEEQEILLMVYLVSCFIPGFPHPLLNIYGAQGSAKSQLCKILRKLIDPSAIEVASIPRDEKELAQMLSHHWCIYFDNLSSLPDWLSDILCKAVSGDGFSKRELYSDDEDVIYSFRRCIGINGINISGLKPDLLERSILLELERVTPEKRREENELMALFEAERPAILGGILDVIVSAMQIKPTIKVSRLPRMADFAIWGCAIAEALGYGQEKFMNAYWKNISRQNEEILGDSVLATAIRAFMSDRKEWEDTPSILLKELNSVAEGMGIDVAKEKHWPKAANALGRQLNELKTNLSTDGIKITRVDHDKRRIIRIQKSGENTVETDLSPPLG